MLNGWKQEVTVFFISKVRDVIQNGYLCILRKIDKSEKPDWITIFFN